MIWCTDNMSYRSWSNVSTESITWLRLMPLSDWISPPPCVATDVRLCWSFERFTQVLCCRIEQNWIQKVIFLGKWNNSVAGIAALDNSGDVRSWTGIQKPAHLQQKNSRENLHQPFPGIQIKSAANNNISCFYSKAVPSRCSTTAPLSDSIFICL